MGASATYEQHVFGLELQDKFLGPLAKSYKLLEKNAAAWDKFEARVHSGGLNKAMSRVNGLIARFESLEKIMDRLGHKKIGSFGGAGGGGHGGSVMDNHDARRKYEVWWESQLKRQETSEARALARKEAQQQRMMDRLRLDQQRAMERDAKQQQTMMRPFANMWARIGLKMQQQQFKKAQQEAEKLRQNLEKIGGHLRDAVGILKSGLAGLVGSGIEYGSKFVSSIVEAAKERGLLMTAYEVQLGSREKAERQLQKTLDIAQLTPASNMGVVDVTKKLMGAQFQGRRLDAARAAWADVQAFGGDQAARQIQFWMSRMAARGEASTAGISGVAKAGISERFIREEIAKQMGKSVGYKEGGPYTDKMDKAVRDAVSQRKVSSGQFEIAVERAVLRTLKQTELGAYAKKKGVESLAGVLSNIEEAVPTFLMRLNIDQWSGIKELKRFLVDLLSFFSLGTKEGQQLAKIVEDLTNELLGGLKNISRDDMARFFEDAAAAARELTKWIGQAWDMVGNLLRDTEGKGLSGFLDTAGTIIGDAIGRALAATLPSIMEALVKAIPGALKGTIVGAGKGAWSLGTDLGHDFQGWFNSTILDRETGGGAIAKAAERNRRRIASAEGAAAISEPTLSNDDLMSHGETANMSVSSHAGGGTVPGMPGKPRLIIAHGQEKVIPAGSRSSGIQIGQLTIQCDESAMRMLFSEWLQQEIDDAVDASGT
jgi:hypothetical protein